MTVVTMLTLISLSHTRCLSAPLVLNGSFEAPSLGVNGFALGAGAIWSSSSTPGSFGGPGVWDDAYLSFTRIPAIDGRQVLWMPPGTSASQTISLTAGTSYLLSFFTTPQIGNTIDTELFVTLTSGSQSVAGGYGIGQGSSVWTNSQLTFTAADTGTYTATFFAKDTWTLYGNSAVLYLDNVSLTAVSESGSSSYILGIAILGIVVLRREHSNIRP